jgi:tetratricopeptide (TPR) repeat protein
MPQARADLRTGEQKFLHGNYEGARSDFLAVRGAERARARLALARVLLRTGDYEGADRELATLVNDKDPVVASDATVLRAELWRLRGRLAEARTALESFVASRPEHLRGRYFLGMVYRDLGQLQPANKIFESFFDDWNAGKIDRSRADQLLYVAAAARQLSAYQDANDTFRDATDRDPNLLEANLEWGYLFLEKYAAGYAEQSFDEVLKIDPKHPDAHAGMAQVKLEQNYDIAGALDHLQQALTVNPRHIPSLLVRAGLEIDQNQWDKAQSTIDQILAVDPGHAEARSLRATIHWLRDDTAQYEAEKKKVLGANPSFARFYHLVARSAVREHRYIEAIELEKQAVALDPDNYEAMQALGTGYLRLGLEQEGLKWLRKAWKGDNYNVRTFNTLELFEETIPKEYVFAESGSFKIRYHKEEKEVLARQVVPLLERAFASMSSRYGFRPRTPIVVELFRDPDHYSVRTIGLPNLGALGVCFGRVITAMSPSAGDINWGMVLWHELSHVFAIQLSNSRVPRWFTEGLSEYETLIGRPEWRRENDADLWAALQEGTLPSVTELNYGFMKPDMQQVVVAYYLSAVTIEYIVATYGFAKILEALRLFGRGLETDEVLSRITGVEIAAFDRNFRDYLAVRLAPYKGSLYVPTRGYEDVSGLAARAAAAPTDPEAQASLALAHFYDGNAEAAEKAARRTLERAPGHRLALYVLGELALRARRLPQARNYYHALIKNGGDNFDVRARLAMIATERKEFAEAERQLCAAKKLDPERSYPYQTLSELHDKRGNTARSLVELESYVMLEQMQFAPLKRLVEDYSARKQWHKVRRYGEMALLVNPFDADVLLKLGQAQIETGNPERALVSFDTALATRPEPRRPALAHLGRARALAALQRNRDAAEAVGRALALEPDHVEAQQLQKSLRRPR